MTLRKIVTVSITPEQDAFARGRVGCGRFGSVSEVVRAGLRLLEQSEAAYDREARQGSQKGTAPQKRGNASGPR